MMNARKMPIGIQDFTKLRESGFVYVDKTEIIYNLAKNECPYFLSRPRRFGKSLLITTLEAYFLGKKDLFRGLAIENLEKDWIEYPVLKFSLAGGEFTQTDGLRKTLNRSLSVFEQKYGLQEGDSNDLPGRFFETLKNANEKTGRKVAVLIDEYDNPLLKNIGGSSEQDEANRALYKGFFAVLKDCDGYLRFVLFTGVTKFSKVSIFSDLNQLQDISMHSQYAEICGITQSELESTFAPEIDALAAKNHLTREGCLQKLKRLYDGYKFSQECENIYNPFSLINAFSSLKFGKFWFGTGTPTFLVKRLNEMGFNPKRFSDGSLYASEDGISDYRPDNPDIVPLLYQSGYLTIKDYDERRERFVLGYPNDEVKYGFMNSLATEYLNLKRQSANNDIFAIDDAVEAGDTDTLRDQFISLFASLPYPAAPSDNVFERDFQNVVYLVFYLLGQFVQVEQHSAKGRADCIVETDEYVYIFEFKRDDTAENALAQIDGAGYAKPYEADSRKLIKIGAVFSSTERTLTEWLVKL
ncbi:MAG: ATP-binding protein [Treponema sp.]|nr:ATP-binding protein [Treponema sp.]